MLKLEQVRAGYDGAEVLHGISFELATGENLAVNGPNGCGKTTLLRAIMALMPYSGSITLDGQPIAGRGRRDIARKIALMGQMPTMQAGYSVRETVLLGRYAHSRPGLLGRVTTEDSRAVDEALAAVGLENLGDRDIGTLSGGQLQRVFVAKTLAQDPQVILLDEPTNHLDLCHQVELISYLKAWSQVGGRSVIGVLHDINLAMLFSHKILLMKSGETVAFGDRETVLSATLLQAVYGMDVAAYMKESLARWQEIAPGEEGDI